MADKKEETKKTVKEMLEGSIIKERPLEKEMDYSFISYAMAVNVSRAIPDVRDGLKPVHRRILFDMDEQGLTSDKPFRKCASVVGDVLGKYHPHGDSSVYDAMVRLAQDFSIRCPLIDGHGNFGSVDGDGAAAYRYTEARMSKIASEMVRDIDKNTVDMKPNFDNTRNEPVVLPARFPNLLVNGSDGIAVGMATSIPPHNLSEVIDGTIALIDNPDLEVEDLMQYIKAPDFPTKALILGNEGIKEAYKTGRGSCILRSRVEIEEDEKGKSSLVITEIPYQVIKSQLVESIAALVRDDKIKGISSIKEHSDRDGMRVVIEIKKDAVPQVVLNHLYKQTQLQTSFSMIMLALVDGKPRILNLKQILEEYIKHQKSVITRRTTYDLTKAQERAHIVEGLLLALKNIDEVIKTIKSSEDRQSGIQNLMSKHNLSERQAVAIMEMKLQSLTHLASDKLEEELAELNKAIADFEDILAKPERVAAIIKQDLLEIKDKYGAPRLSEITFDPANLEDGDFIKKEDVAITITSQGYIKRMPVAEYKAQNKGGMGKTAHKTKEDDFVQSVIITHSHDDMLFFSNKGKVYRIKAYQIPEATNQSKGRAIVNLLTGLSNEAENKEKINAFVPVPEKFIEEYARPEDKKAYLILATKQGLIKKTSLDEFVRIQNNGKIAISLVDDDELIAAALTTGDDQIIMASTGGKCIRFHEKDIRETGRSSQGVKSISLDKDERVVDMAIVREGQEVLTITENGYGKRTSLDEYTLQGRAGKGVKVGVLNEKTGNVVNLKLVDPEKDDIIIVTNKGVIMRVKVDQISKMGRNTQGVIIKKNEKNEVVAAIAAVPHMEEVEETEETSEKVENSEE
jgi:DNA gyrase subunit A